MHIYPRKSLGCGLLIYFLDFINFFVPGSGGLLLSEEEGATDPAANQAEEQDWCGPAPGNTGL